MNERIERVLRQVYRDFGPGLRDAHFFDTDASGSKLHDVHAFYHLSADPSILIHVQGYPGLSTEDEMQVFARQMDYDRWEAIRACNSVSIGNEYDAVTKAFPNFASGVRIPYDAKKLEEMLEENVHLLRDIKGHEMVQEFKYETDSLKSFEAVLGIMVRNLYDDGPSEFTQLFITKNPVGFNYEHETYLDIITKENKPKYFFICSLSDCKAHIKKDDETFSSYDELVQKVMEQLRTAEKKVFIEHCGEGYYGSFQKSDGLADRGFRLDLGFDGGSPFLEVSLCHIYYGK